MSYNIEYCIITPYYNTNPQIFLFCFRIALKCYFSLPVVAGALLVGLPYSISLVAQWLYGWPNKQGYQKYIEALKPRWHSIALTFWCYSTFIVGFLMMQMFLALPAGAYTALQEPCWRCWNICSMANCTFSGNCGTVMTKITSTMWKLVLFFKFLLMWFI